MSKNIVKARFENLSPPRPVFGERGAGGEGLNRSETRPLTPALSPTKPGAREEMFVSRRISSKHPYCLVFNISISPLRMEMGEGETILAPR